MKTSILDARTVAIVRPLKTETKQGANGTFESKDILVRIAVNRDYKVTRVENGKTISEYPTDFWLAKFTGNLAQIFADNCCATKEDGKLASRHLLLSGSFENYTNTRKVHVTPQVNINGMLYQLELDVDVPNNNNTIFVVDGITFLDSNPAKAQATATPAVTMAVATPVAQPVTAPVAQPVAQPVVAPVAPVAQAVAPAVQPVAVVTAETAPVVCEGFSATGETAPF